MYCDTTGIPSQPRVRSKVRSNDKTDLPRTAAQLGFAYLRYVRKYNTWTMLFPVCPEVQRVLVPARSAVRPLVSTVSTLGRLFLAPPIASVDMSEPALTQYFLNTVFGALLIGGYGAAALCGMSYIQVYTYFTHTGRTDRVFLRWIVVVLTLLNTFNTFLSLHAPYNHMVTNYGHLIRLTRIIWSLAALHVCSELSNVVIRLLYAHRIWLLSNGNVPVTVWIVIVSIGNLASCTFLSIRLLLYPDVVSGNIAMLEWMPRVSFVFSATAELSVTVSLCYYLHRAKTGFKKTNSLIATLIRYVVMTGVIASVDGLISIILYWLYLRTNLAALFYTLLSKLYFCSYLALLNAREALRDTSAVHTSLEGGTVIFEKTQQSETHVMQTTDTCIDQPTNEQRC